MKKLAALALGATSAALALIAFPGTSASQPTTRPGLPGPIIPPPAPTPLAPVSPPRINPALANAINARTLPPIAITDSTRSLQTFTDVAGQMVGAGPNVVALLGEDGKVTRTFPTRVAKPTISPHNAGALVLGDPATKSVSILDVRTGAVTPLVSLAGILDSSRNVEPGSHLLASGELTAVASDGANVYVAMAAGFSSAIFKIDPKTRQITDRGWVSAADPRAMVHHNGALLVLVGKGGQVRRFTTALKRSRDNIDLPQAGATGIGVRGTEIRAINAGSITRAQVGAADLALPGIIASLDQPIQVLPKPRIKYFPPLNLTKRYAVLITGDLAENFWGECFWNDTVWMYKTLLANGYAAEDIFVLYGDGNDYASPNPTYQHGSRVTDYAANSTNVNIVLDGLANGDAARGIPKMDSNDTLFVWTFDHGGRSGAESTLCLRDGCMLASAFSTKMNAITYSQRAIFMQQCFSGGFIDPLKNAKTYISTAARADEVARPADTENEMVGGRTYSHGEYNYWITSAFNRLTPTGGVVNADSNADTWISASEAHARNVANESQAETPQMNDMGGVGPLFRMKK